MKKAYGNTPIEWGSVRTMPTFFFKESTRRIEASPLAQAYPFGAFIGISSKMMYTLRTEGIRIGEELKKGAESLVGSPGF